MKLDHLVILVTDLAKASADYSALGFTVTPGGVHADGLTENALIAFADGAYLELIAFRDGGTAQSHRWWPFLERGGGLIDFALQVADLPASLAAISGRGGSYDGPYESGRQKPDGSELRWRSAWSSTRVGLPFLIEDLTPRSLRVPEGVATRHANGARGIGMVVVAVPQIAVATTAYTALLGLEQPRIEADEALMSHVARLPLGSVTLLLAQPQVQDLPLAQQISVRGAGIYACWLVTEGETASLGWLNRERSHGARLQLVAAGES